MNTIAQNKQSDSNICNLLGEENMSIVWDAALYALDPSRRTEDLSNHLDLNDEVLDKMWSNMVEFLNSFDK